MPPIPSQYLNSVVYLYPSEAAAEGGDGAGGSGFLAGVPIGWEAGPMDTHFAVYALYVVTNAHVVEQGATHARLMNHDGVPRIVAVPADSWHLHPDGDDVAVFPLDATNHEFACIPWNDFVPETNAVLPGDDIFILVPAWKLAELLLQSEELSKRRDGQKEEESPSLGETAEDI